MSTYDFRPTGLTLEPGERGVVRASGRLTFSPNPERVRKYGPPPALPGGLSTVGPLGFPPNGPYGVSVQVRGPNGVAPLALRPVDFGAETVGDTVMGPGELEVARLTQVAGGAGCISNPPPGFPCGCPDHLCVDSEHDYNVTGTQTLSVEPLVPARVMIKATAGAFEVRPAERGNNRLPLTVGVYDQTGAPIPNRNVSLVLEAIPGSGGHDHDGERPTGGVAPGLSLNTGASGVAEIVYVAPTPSGLIRLTGRSSGAQEDQKEITVRVSPLVAIGRAGVAYTFQSSSHHASNDFWLAPGAIGVMDELWNAWIQRSHDPVNPYPMAGSTFTLTAAALVWGGLYDIAGDWAPPHSTHRQGGDVDFDDDKAETDPDLMSRHCQKFLFQGMAIRCDLHNGNHYHAYLGPNR